MKPKTKMRHKIYLTNKSKTPDIQINGQNVTVLTDQDFLKCLDEVWARNSSQNYESSLTDDVAFENQYIFIDYDTLKTASSQSQSTKPPVQDPDEFIKEWLVKLKWPI